MSNRLHLHLSPSLSSLPVWMKRSHCTSEQREWRRQPWNEGSQLGIVMMVTLTQVSNEENQNEDRVTKNKRWGAFEKYPPRRRSKLCNKISRKTFFSGGLVDVVAPTIERGQQVWEKMGRFVRKTCGFELPECLQDVMSEMVEYVGLVYCFKRFANLWAYNISVSIFKAKQLS